MPQAKYFSEIDRDKGGDENTPRRFDLNRIAASGRFAKIGASLKRKGLPRLYAFSRAFNPVMKLGGLIHISRDEQVRDVLLRGSDFPVPFGKEMSELGLGATFLLGVDGAEHTRLRQILASAVLPHDAEMMRRLAAEFTAALLDNHPGKIDVVHDLIKRVPAEICIRYFGLDCQDADALADWTLAISALLFGDPFGDPVVRELAFQARDKLSAYIGDAIARTRREVLSSECTVPKADTLVHRLLILQRDGAELSDKDIAAILLGMASGFIPTNSIAASNMLTEILARPDAKAAAEKAAKEGDSDTLRRILLEAGRLNPTLYPGQFRICPDGAVLQVDGRPQQIPPKSTLIVATGSAMRDKRVWQNPDAFRIDRKAADGSWQEPDLLFGLGPHTCIGKEMAIGQISGVFAELFARDGLKPAAGKSGKLEYLGLFPRHLTLEYDTPSSRQSMYLIIAPVTDGSSREDIEAEIAAWGHPAIPEIRDDLDQSNIVHFASIAPIESERGLDIIFEMNCDGSIGSSIKALCRAIGPRLDSLLIHTARPEAVSLEAYLLAHVVELHGKPWGPTGLNYNGLAEFPVSKVEREQKFADFMGRVMRDFVATESARGSNPMLALGHMRRILRQDPVMKARATPVQLDLMEEAERERFDAFHLSTRSMRLALSTFKDPGSHFNAAINFLKSRDGLLLLVPFIATLSAMTVLAFEVLGGLKFSNLLFAVFSGLTTTVLVFGVVGAVFLALIRRLEKKEKPFEKRASLTKMRRILAAEDLPGYAQNHVFASAMLKPGLFRTFLHAFGLWAAKMSIVHRFRPGMINGMGTIHYARWYKIPGTRRAVFYSNFDGSWESYLEDFISRVSWGQSAAWSNWEGFPETRFLFMKGAQDSDQFKNYTRTVMRVSPFWYSRFPELSSEQIRQNGLIHIGAGLARTSTEAEEWLRCFGSRPRHANLVEQDEVQALVLRGMKRLPYSVCLALTLPPAGEKLGEWLCWIRGKPMQIEGLLGQSEQAQTNALIDEGVIDRVPRPDGHPPEYSLAHALTITFGDRPLLGIRKGMNDPAGLAMGHAAFLGISAAGMKKFTADGTAPDAVEEGMPFAFRMGMGGRGQILGDPAPADRNWYWDDNVESDNPAEAVLMLYASDPASLDRMTTIHRALLGNHGGSVQTQIDCAPAWDDTERVDFEHFGFRDGISQPVMRATGKSTKNVPERDIVEPGEFIIGYKNNSGYFPMSPKLPPEADVSCALPVTIGGNLSRFPDFGGDSLANAERDLGRNGTFIVLRELKQNVEGFDAFAEEAAKKLNTGGFADLYKVIGQRPDAEWVKAKMMGRWRDGRPLIGNPVNNDPQASADPAERDNDFTFGSDDPQGLACPFAAHIRRTNPRDSKHPGDPNEQAISNRHRLLRRGRPYVRKDTGEKGLLFACIGTDIERQFEFVQQFWANAPAFHGLDNEPDPVIGANSPDTATGEPRTRHFSIPTPVGPVRLEGLQSFVEPKGGGYFFMPSRSALGWLCETARHASPVTIGTEREDNHHD